MFDVLTTAGVYGSRCVSQVTVLILTASVSYHNLNKNLTNHYVSVRNLNSGIRRML